MTPKDRLLKAFGTASEVARVAGVTRQCIHNWWVRGRIGKANAIELAHILDIPVKQLAVEWVPDQKPKRRRAKAPAKRPAKKTAKR